MERTYQKPEVEEISLVTEDIATADGDVGLEGGANPSGGGLNFDDI